MPDTFKRTDKTSQLIQEALAKLIQLEVRDPRLPKVLTLSRVVVSSDLSNARVYFTVLGGPEEGKNTANVLNHAAKYLRASLVKSVKLRIAPRLYFVYDEEMAEAAHLSSLIAGLNIKSDDSDN